MNLSPMTDLSPHGSSKPLIEELRALGGVRVRFQPVIALGDEDVCSGRFRLVGLECLTRGPVDTPYESAASLFAEARRRSEAPALDRFCMEMALAGVARLGNRVGRKFDLFLNVHASTLEARRDLFEDLEEAAQRAGVAMRRIIVEVIEAEPMLRASGFQVAIHNLRRAGARIALDDVGQGFCTNQLILATRPDFIKLDRFLVRGSYFDVHRRALISSYHHLAQQLGIGVIAEGVESCTEIRALRKIGISLCQGYLFARPQEPEQLVAESIVEDGVHFVRAKDCAGGQ